MRETKTISTTLPCKKTAKILAVAMLLSVIVFTATTVNAQWRQVNEDGFGSVGANSTTALVYFRGHLYAGTENPGKLYRTDRRLNQATGRFRWEPVTLPRGVPGADPFEPRTIVSMAELRTATNQWLYMAVSGESGGEKRSFVIRSHDGIRWTNARCNVLHYPLEYVAMGVFDGHLYVVTGDTETRTLHDSMQLFRTDGTGWEYVRLDLELGPSDVYFGDLQTFGSYLYGGTSGPNDLPGADRTCEIWRTRNGSDWVRVAELHSPTMAEVESMAVFKDQLYVGTKNHPQTGVRMTGPQMWRTRNGLQWERIHTEGQFPLESLHVDVLQVYGGYLYAGLGGGNGGAQLYRSIDGSRWNRVTPRRLDEDRDNYLLGSMTAVDCLYIGTGFNRVRGTEIWEHIGSRTVSPPTRMPPAKIRPIEGRRIYEQPRLQDKVPTPVKPMSTPLVKMMSKKAPYFSTLKANSIGTVEKLASTDALTLSRLINVDERTARKLINDAKKFLRGGKKVSPK